MESAPLILVPAMFNFGSGIHWIIILVIALLLFGRRLPGILRGLGTSVREFRKGVEEGVPEADGKTPGQPANPAGTDAQRSAGGTVH